MRTVITLRRLAWLAPAVALAACSGKKEAQQAAASNTMKPESAAAPMAAPPPAPVTVDLASKPRSHITGTVTLTVKGDSTEVVVDLKGARKGTTYPSHIHEGTCAKEGKVVFALTSVKAGVDGTGSSTTMVLTSALDSARTQYGSLFEQSHFPNMKPAACGDIPAK
jgi:hypothetical protein